MSLVVLILAVCGGIVSASIAIFVCVFAFRNRGQKAARTKKNSSSKAKHELEPILPPDRISSESEGDTNKGNVSPCPSCRKISTFYSPCECDMISAQNLEAKPCQVQFSLYYNFHDSHLFINIICALNVPLRWYGKHPPTQVRFQLLPDDSNVYRTEIKSNTGEPIFNETFEFIGYSENELMELTLRLGLYAFDKFSRGKMIGFTDLRFDLEKFHPSEPTIIWRNLLPKSQTRGRSLSFSRGEIHISLRYEAKRQRLNVIILKATNLMKTSKFLNIAPYVCVNLNANEALLETRQTKKTRGVNPVWNQGFLFDVDGDTVDEYSITIRIMNHDLLTSDEVIGEITIGSQCEGSGKEHWDETMRKRYTRREVAMTHILS
ncbi:synaptotagmin-C-like [Orbicella faveolata]|uniref:synaptotagmin-C-like n=1 Tax=Orbicella faveolata TaxID=48498 RepID=UPI0009E3685D|nr:synaptotagmin-C-like [Orbicella faveolata]